MKLNRMCQIIFLIIGITIILSYGSALLIPLVGAIIIAMILTPVLGLLQRWGVGEQLSIALSVLLVIAIGLGLLGGIATQVNAFAEDWDQTEEQLNKKWENTLDFAAAKTGFKESRIRTRMNKEVKTLFGALRSRAGGIAGSFFGIIGNLLLVLVYTFFLLLERERFKRFILKASKDGQEAEAADAMDDMLKVVNSYLVGNLVLIVILATVYSIGFLIIGLKYGVFLAILAAVLAIIPYVGNIIGGSFALLAAFATQDGWNGIIGVVIVMAIAQFIESYIIQPFLVGSKVNLNPFFTIFGVVAFSALWGVVGSILAIPILAITKVMFDYTQQFSKLGYMMGDD